MFHVGQNRVSNVVRNLFRFLRENSLRFQIIVSTAIARIESDLLKAKRKSDPQLLLEIKRQGCCICGRSSADAAHIRSVGAGGPDEEFNLIPLCRAHHRLQHDKGWQWFAKNHIIIRIELELKGWKFDEFGKLWNKKLTGEKK